MISTDGAEGRRPIWAPSGQELFYDVRGKLMVVPVRTKPGFVADRPRPVFEATELSVFDVSPDGQRFLAVQQTEKAAAPSQIVVVPGFSDELRARLAPPRK